ncbi:MAG: leucine-rich repeat protein [Ruminococcus sp.]
MKLIRKIVSLLLALLMLLGIFVIMPIGTSALITEETVESAEPIENTKSTTESTVPTEPVTRIFEDYKYEILEDGTAKIIEYTGNAKDLEIPDIIDGYTVTSIGNCAFNYCENLVSVTIPSSVTSIDEMAFILCISLKKVTIPSSVINIGYEAFHECYSLISINVDINNKDYCSIDGNLYNKDQTTIIKYAIGKTDTSFIIPNSVTSIGNWAFKSCKSLTDVTISSSVTSIGFGSFSDIKIKKVYYAGSKSQWDAINVESGNESIKGATIYYNSTGPNSCEHNNIETTGEKEATYFAKGYTGDKVCVDCSKIVSKGKLISKLVLNTPRVTVKPAKKAVTVKYTKVKHAQGFVVSYRIGKKTYTKTFKGNKSKTVKISNLKKGKKYSVKVRAYTISMKKKAYSLWTKAKTVKVK